MIGQEQDRLEDLRRLEEALEVIKESDLSELKSLKNPPITVQLVIQVLAKVLGRPME